MKTTNLKKTIKKLQDKLTTEIPYLNYGGCGVFAYIMHKKLTQMGLTPTIVVLDYYREDKFDYMKGVIFNSIFNNEYNTKELEFDLLESSFSHCLVEVDGLLFDSEDFFNDDFLIDNCKSVSEYSPKELNIALRYGSWNSTFNRREQAPIIKKIVKQTLKL